MSVTAKNYGSMTVLSVEPAMGRAESETFRQVAADQVHTGGQWVILDLSKVTDFDSQGLEDLLWFQDELTAAGGEVNVAGLKGHCRDIFRMVRFDKKFETFASVTEALEHFH